LPENTRSSNPQYRVNQASPPTIRWELPTRAESNERPQEREPRAQATTHSSSLRRPTSHGTRPAVNERRSGTFGRVELPVEGVREIEVPREGRRISFQPPPPPSSNLSQDSGPSSNATPRLNNGTYQEDTTHRDELRARRRRRANMEAEPEEHETQNRAFELPASTQLYPSSRRIVRERGPLSDLERRLNPQYQRPAFHGYASEEDVSQLGSSTIGE
jgi:hypothetical protein